MEGKNYTIKDRMDYVQSVLDEYESEIGLPRYAKDAFEDIDEYFNLTKTELHKLGPEDCAEIGIRLCQFALYTQQKLNTELSRCAWAEHELKNLVSPLLVDYDKFIKYENKVALICLENEAAKKLDKIISYTQQRINRLQFISGNIRNLSEDIKSYGRIKSFLNKD